MTAITASPWIRRLSRPQARPRFRLLCCPYAGGSASVFAGWARHLPDIEILALQYPGREERLRETPQTDLITMVGMLTEELVPHLAEVPYAVFGHSMGALIGFELTRQIERLDCPPPRHLFVSGAGAPQLQTPRDPPRHLWPQPVLLDELRRINGTPAELLENDELMAMVLPMLRADFSVVDTYRWDGVSGVDTPVTAFGGLEDLDVDHGMLAGWREQSRSDFRMAMFAGDHFYLNGAASLLGSVISDTIDCTTSAGMTH